MNLCDDGHQEVCFEGRLCPVCARIADLNTDIELLNDRIAELEKELEEAERANQ